MDRITPQHLQNLLEVMHSALPKFDINPKTLAEYAAILKDKSNKLVITGIKNDNKELCKEVAQIINTAMLMQIVLISEGWDDDTRHN